MDWSVEYVNETAKAEFLELPDDMLAYMLRIVSLIEKFGLPNVGMPYVRPLREKLWEMRGRGRDGIVRSIYIAHTGQRVVILRTFIKKFQKTPDSEIALALKRAKEIKNE